MREFKEGDIVWYIDDHEIVCSEIVCVSLCERPIGYDFIVTKRNLRRACQFGDKVGIHTCRLFSSKEALLEHLEQNVTYDCDKYGYLVSKKQKKNKP